MLFRKIFAMNEGAQTSAPAATPAAPASTSATSSGSLADRRAAATANFLKPIENAEQMDIFATEDFSEFENEGNLQDPVAGIGENSGNTAEDTATTGTQQFSPYSYKGSVLGQEVEQTFSTQKELDQCIQRGLAAPKIYNDYTKLREQAETWKKDSEHVSAFYDLAQKEPKEFLEMVFDELIDEGTAADWVYGKYQRFADIARMSPAEREHYKKLKDAERIIAESREAERQRKLLAEQEAMKGIENDRKYVSNWRTGVVESLKKEVPPAYHSHIKEALDLVMLQAKQLVDSDPKMTVAKACALAEKKLKTLLEPYKRISTPENAKRQVADALAQKTQQATSKLQGVASAKQGVEPEKKDNRSLSERRASVFKEMRYHLAKGAK